MRLRDLPGVTAVFESGPDDRVFDSLLLLGPPIIAVILVLGRSLFTEALAVAYLGSLVSYVLYRGIAAS